VGERVEASAPHPRGSGVARAIDGRVLELARVYGGSPPVVIPLKQDDLAALAGTSRATVNRVLRDAERRGLVELGRGRTVLLDLEGMARLARAATGQLRSGLEAASPDGS